MQATGMQGMCTRACVPAERVEAGRGRALGAPLSGLLLGKWGGLCCLRAAPATGMFPSSPCRTGAGSRLRGRVAMPRLPIAGALPGPRDQPPPPPGWESPNPHLCAKIKGGGGRSPWSAGPPLPFPGRVRPAGSGGGRSAGRQATTPAAEGLSPAGHPCPGHQGARPPSPEGAPVPQPRAPEAAPACGLAAPARTPRPQPGLQVRTPGPGRDRCPSRAPQHPGTSRPDGNLHSRHPENTLVTPPRSWDAGPRGWSGTGRPRAQPGPDPGRGCGRGRAMPCAWGRACGRQRQGRPPAWVSQSRQGIARPFSFSAAGTGFPPGRIALPAPVGWIGNRAHGQGVQGLNNKMDYPLNGNGTGLMRCGKQKRLFSLMRGSGLSALILHEGEPPCRR